MTSWFDIVHYTLVGFGVCFLILLLILAWQGIVKVILLAYGNRDQTTTVHHTHSEEHRVHHVHHAVDHQPTGDVFEATFGDTTRSRGTKSNNHSQITQVQTAQKAITKSPIR